MNLKDNNQELIEQALMKRALGYETEEITEEYSESGDGAETRLVKRKVLKKSVPPDITAVKVLLEMSGASGVSGMTDKELSDEKNRLLRILSETEETEEKLKST